MAIEKFIPEVWSARMLRILEPKLIIAQPRIMNRNWEGDIAEKGDTVHIRTFTGGGQIKDYVRNTPGGLGDPDRPSDGELTLTVDQAKAFYIAVDDVDKAQADLSIMDKFLERTMRNLALVLDAHAGQKLLAGAAAANVIGAKATPVSVSAENTPASTGWGTTAFTPYTYCVEARKRLQKQSTPGDDRWMIVNADLEAEFLNDPKFTEGGGGIADASVVRQGLLGTIAGFQILTTEAVPTFVDADGDDTEDTGEEYAGTAFASLYGDGNYGLTWADQVVKVEAERLQGEFGDALKGLNVFGAKVVEGESIGVAHVNPVKAA